MFVTGLLIIAKLLTFVFMLPLGYSRTIMHESRQKDYDCITIGSSEVMYAIDPERFDSLREGEMMSLGSEGTLLNGGEYAVFDDYLKDHKGEHAPKMLILMQGTYEVLNTGNEDPTSYSLLVPALNHLSSRMAYYYRACEADGLWIERMLYFKDAINADVRSNISTKLSADYRDHGHRHTNDIVYKGRGHITRDASVKTNVIDYSTIREADPVSEMTALPEVDLDDINDVYKDTFFKIADRCAKADIRLVVVMAPVPVQGYMNADYHRRYSALKAMSALKGVEFYDLNLAHEDVYDPDSYGFYDLYHVNDVGARIYTEALASVLNRVDAGEDPDDMFYTWEEMVKRQ